MAKPFHETIVRIIRNETAYDSDMAILQKLIMATRIPKNHDAIAMEWKETCVLHHRNPRAVLNYLAQQKQEAETTVRRCPKRKAEFTKQNPETPDSGLCRECATGGMY